MSQQTHYTEDEIQNRPAVVAVAAKAVEAAGIACNDDELDADTLEILEPAAEGAAALVDCEKGLMVAAMKREFRRRAQEIGIE